MATKITSIKVPDKISELNHNSGNINMASGAVLSIGGLQYKTDAVKTVALPTMVANTRYQIFAVVSSGDVILVISTSENSAGPSGYSSWKLVGSLYANGANSPAFGTFINIEGVPCAEWDSGVTRLTSSGGFLTKGTSSVDVTRSIRIGNTLKFVGNFRQTTAGSGGSGVYYMLAPTNITIDDTAWPLGNAAIDSARGSGYATTNTDGRHCVCWNAGGGSIGLQFGSGTNTAISASTHPVSNISFGFCVDYQCKIQNWSNTQIKDL